MLTAVWDGDAAALDGGVAAVTGAGLLYERTDPHGGREHVFRHALMRDAAYASLLRERRRALHQRAADHLITLRERGRRGASYELIAHHLSEAGNVPAALSYWLRAGEAAAGTSSYRECEAHLRRGLALIAASDRPETFAREELELLVLLGPALMALYGYSAAPVGRAYERARALSEAMAGKPHLTPILNGLRLHHATRNALPVASETAAALLEHAEATGDDASRIEGRKALGSWLVWTGQFDRARDSLLGAIALYESGENMDVMRLDSDSGMTCHSFMSLVEWAAGFLDRSRSHSETALAIATRARRTFGLGEALSFRALLLHLLREHGEARSVAREAYRLADEHGYVLWKAKSSLVHGATSIRQGDGPRGLEELRGSRRLMHDMGYALWQPLYLIELGCGYRSVGDAEAALAHLDEATELMVGTGETFWQPEAHHRRAEVLLDTGSPRAAESAFREAIECARQIGSPIYALRAATGLARHWCSSGRMPEAKALLAPIYGAFTEGFDVPDLRDARALLDEMPGPDPGSAACR